ncbi:MAG: hypothetical protein ACRED8_04665, partial [Caulobacteraceae bacterium]
VTTHQVEEVQHILTDLVFIDRGRIALSATMEAVEQRYCELLAAPEKAAEARTLSPVHERSVFGRGLFIYDGVPRERLAPLGDVRTPSVADLFVAVMSPPSSQERRAA